LILLDTSGLLAAIDGSQNDHAAAAEALRSAGSPLILSPFVLAELDYLLAARVGSRAELALLDEVADGAYQLEAFDRSDVAAAVEYVRRYDNIELGLADASIIVLADRHGTSDVLTLDERHFRTVRRAAGQAFRMLPADARR
jgi:predicted nucleic acid-binding protein